MPRKRNKQTKQVSPNLVSAQQTTFGIRKIIIAVGGLSGIILIILALVPILQTERDRREQQVWAATEQSSNATSQAIDSLRLELDQALATALALNPNPQVHGTQTAISQQLSELNVTATQQAFLYPVTSPTPQLNKTIKMVLAFDLYVSNQDVNLPNLVPSISRQI